MDGRSGFLAVSLTAACVGLRPAAFAASMIYYDANGGTGAPSPQTVGNGSTISKTNPSRWGYNFAGWSKTSGGSVDYHSGDTYTGNGNETLYAVWRTPGQLFPGVESQDVRFYPGQTVYFSYTPTTSGIYHIYTDREDYDPCVALYDKDGTLLAGSLSVPIIENDEWDCDYLLQAGTKYYYGLKLDYSGYTNYQYMYFYFILVRPITTLFYDANGGTGAPEPQDCENNPKISTVNPSRWGYNFVGWAETSGGGAVYHAGDTYTGNGSKTLYAVWQTPSNLTPGHESQDARFYPGQTVYFRFTPSITAVYHIYTDREDYNPCIALYDAGGNLLARSLSVTMMENDDWDFNYLLEADVTYYYGLKLDYAGYTGYQYLYFLFTIIPGSESVGVPQNVTAAPSADRTITVKWGTVRGATQYNIYRYNGTKHAYEYKGTTFADAARPTEYADKNLHAGTTYYYKAVAVTKAEGLTLVSAKSDYANAQAIGTPAAPQQVQAVSKSAKTVTVSWEKAAGATQYNVYRYNGSKKSYVYAGTSYGASYNVTGLSSGTTYYFKVMAVTKGGGLTLVGPYSSVVHATVK